MPRATVTTAFGGHGRELDWRACVGWLRLPGAGHSSPGNRRASSAKSASSTRCSSTPRRSSASASAGIPPSTRWRSRDRHRRRVHDGTGSPRSSSGLLRHPVPDLRVADVGHAAVRRRLRLHEPDRAAGRAIPRLARELDCSPSPRSRSSPSRSRSASCEPPDHGRIIGIGTGIGFFNGANSWFTDDSGAVTGVPGFIAAAPRPRPDRARHVPADPPLPPDRVDPRGPRPRRLVLMFVVGLIAITPENFAANLPTYANGMTVDAARPGRQGQRGDRRLHPRSVAASRSSAGIVLLNYIGFQYSAYISGEIRGNVRRGILIAVLGALVVAVLMNSIYTDFLSNRLGVDGQIGWGVLYWLGDPNLPLGQPNSLPLTGTIAAPGLWPIWTLVGAVRRRSSRSCSARSTSLPQPDAARVEPRPPGPGVVRRGVRATAGAGERDPRGDRRRRASSLRSRTSRS